MVGTYTASGAPLDKLVVSSNSFSKDVWTSGFSVDSDLADVGSDGARMLSEVDQSGTTGVEHERPGQ